MNAIIFPSRISGAISAPPSKSYTHRAIFMASLAYGTSIVNNYLHSQDIQVTINCCKQLGVVIDEKNSNTLVVRGINGFVGVKRNDDSTSLNCLNSGTTARLITAFAALTPFAVRIEASKRLQDRPMNKLIEALRFLGIAITELGKTGHLPLLLNGGNLKGGIVEIDANISSQFVSALLLIAPFAKQDLIIRTTATASRPYIGITADMMSLFGVKVHEKNDTFTVNRGSYKPTNYTIEGDYSSASYFFASAAVTGSKVTVSGLNVESVQGDRYFLDILKQMGCMIHKSDQSISVAGKAKDPMDIDLGNYPDIVPTIAVVAATIDGKSVLRNIGHLRFKESNRIQSVMAGLKKMNVDVSTQYNNLIIMGKKNLRPATIETHNDHRIAMSFAVAALAADGKTTIKNASVTDKSYPNFWKDFKKIGVNVKFV